MSSKKLVKRKVLAFNWQANAMPLAPLCTVHCAL